MLGVALLLCSQIAIIGDSLVEDAVNEGTGTWVTKLCTHLAGTACTQSGTRLDLGGNGIISAGGAVAIRNLGDTGDEITVEIDRRYCRHCCISSAVGCATGLGAHFKAIGFEGGVNDTKLSRGADVIWAAQRSQMMDALYHGKNVVLLYHMPTVGAPGWDGAMEAAWQDLATLQTSWCATQPSTRVRCVDVALALDVNADGICDVGFCTDGVHWAAAGGTAAAALIYSVAGPVLQ